MKKQNHEYGTRVTICPECNHEMKEVFEAIHTTTGVFMGFFSLPYFKCVVCEYELIPNTTLLSERKG